MELLIFTLGFLCMLLLAAAALIIWLLRSQSGASRRSRAARRDLETQWENFMNYDGSSVGQRPLEQEENEYEN